MLSVEFWEEVLDELPRFVPRVGGSLAVLLAFWMAGFLILIYKPFKRDDHIAVSCFQGRVAEVNLRFTTLETDGVRVFIPNTLLLTNAVIVGAGGKLVSTPSPLAPQPEQVKN